MTGTTQHPKHDGGTPHRVPPFFALSEMPGPTARERRKQTARGELGAAGDSACRNPTNTTAHAELSTIGQLPHVQ